MKTDTSNTVIWSDIPKCQYGVGDCKKESDIYLNNRAQGEGVYLCHYHTLQLLSQEIKGISDAVMVDIKNDNVLKEYIERSVKSILKTNN